MKTEIVHTVSKPTILKETKYLCEKCSFTTLNKSQANQHELREHSKYRSNFVHGVEFHYLESSEMAEIFHREFCGSYGSSGRFKNPGWYVVEREYSFDEGERYYLTTADNYISDLRDKLHAIESADFTIP